MTSTRKSFVVGGVVASVILIGFGAGAIWMGITGRSEVQKSIAQEQIVGTPDGGSIANKPIENGADAKKFADIIRKHTLDATDGRTYAQMGRFAAKDGTDTNDESAAAVDPKTGEPLPNTARDIWITSTALSTALNTSYFAEQVSVFAIVMGVALLLTGIGFAVLVFGALRSQDREMTILPVRERASDTVAT